MSAADEPASGWRRALWGAGAAPLAAGGAGLTSALTPAPWLAQAAAGPQLTPAELGWSRCHLFLTPKPWFTSELLLSWKREQRPQRRQWGGSGTAVKGWRWPGRGHGLKHPGGCRKDLLPHSRARLALKKLIFIEERWWCKITSCMGRQLPEAFTSRPG